MDSVVLSLENLRDLLIHALRDPTVEACGVILQEAGCAASVYSCRNVAPTPAEGYLIDVHDRRKIERLVQAGLRLVAVYHSHPARGPDPSALDRMTAWEDCAYLIIGLGAIPDLTMRAYRPEGDDLIEIPILVDRGPDPSPRNLSGPGGVTVAAGDSGDRRA